MELVPAEYITSFRMLERVNVNPTGFAPRANLQLEAKNNTDFGLIKHLVGFRFSKHAGACSHRKHIYGEIRIWQCLARR